MALLFPKSESQMAANQSRLGFLISNPVTFLFRQFFYPIGCTKKLAEVDATVTEIRSLTENYFQSLRIKIFKYWVSDLMLTVLNFIIIIIWDSPYFSMYFHRLEKFSVMSSSNLFHIHWIFTEGLPLVIHSFGMISSSLCG